ncbi:TetR/AcrR family transcriptional regulator [Tomitella fengzijianii]|uniref:TetR/AcrR family transcriptional regulator n=1 Tax=Tomitella fengzijianii TaxID=2597660 RepID=A0A516X1H2_9ACTN|nr:TetR/AcrR family transcriptional regulator [Tomitella fengzijianii]QDQ96880.1 TetR/AcrR family transcriptional regulator [Tomitella fengzijianii]
MTGVEPESADTAAEGGTLRDRQKADRRLRLLDAAARLFADRGYGGVSMRDLGAAADVSGPAVYRHFASKQDVLVELLVGISERLLADGKAQVAMADGPEDALERLVAAHARFAVADEDLIRIQDRSLAVLAPEAERRVRRLQREYVELWASTLRELDAGLSVRDARFRAHAAFGLMNSTPHAPSVDAVGGDHAVRLLSAMALAALRAPLADWPV